MQASHIGNSKISPKKSIRVTYLSQIYQHLCASIDLDLENTRTFTQVYKKGNRFLMNRIEIDYRSIDIHIHYIYKKNKDPTSIDIPQLFSLEQYHSKLMSCLQSSPLRVERYHFQRSYYQTSCYLPSNSD